MANSKYEYVRAFERDEILLPNTWIVVRIDGRGFHKLSNHYSFTKPNDVRALNLMNRAAVSVFGSVPDLCVAYGVSDEFSFVFHRSSNLFERRAAKLVSTVVSTFTAAYVRFWGEEMGREVGGEEGFGQGEGGGKGKGELEDGWLPSFDGRAVCYPTIGNLRDYLCWRQVDCHINNLYNTTFWAMVLQENISATEAEEELKGSLAADKNEILFKRFGINYNNEPDMFRKGSVVFKEYALEEGQTSGPEETKVRCEDGGTTTIGGLELHDDEEAMGQDTKESLSKTQQEKIRKARQKAKVVVRHVDIIKDEFWQKRPWILSGKPGRLLVDDQ